MLLIWISLKSTCNRLKDVDFLKMYFHSVVGGNVWTDIQCFVRDNLGKSDILEMKKIRL